MAKDSQIKEENSSSDSNDNVYESRDGVKFKLMLRNESNIFTSSQQNPSGDGAELKIRQEEFDDVSVTILA